MSTIEKYKTELEKVLDVLPDNKIIDLYDFARFLSREYVDKPNSAIDEGSLLVQQQSLAKIWESSEEDFYEL